jgi:hypothetical protein
MSPRVKAATKAASLHLACSIAMAILAAVLVFGLWYPYPYRELSGGRELFLLIIAADVVCGPLLTAVVFNPAKPKAELWRDLGFIGFIQLAALGYGMWTTWQARPLYLALEVDRFKVVMSADVDHDALKALPANLQPLPFGGVRSVALRPPVSVEEKNKVLFASLQGGRDYAERPEFYLPYEGEAAKKSLLQAKPIEPFLKAFPYQEGAAAKLAESANQNASAWRVLPVMGRQDWVAVLDASGNVVGYLKGDGFKD